LNLRTLEADGLIQREVHDLRNPHVEYRLTHLGEALSRLLFLIIDWASAHHQEIVDARERYVPPHLPMRQRQRGWRA
jgi:DNA-binding HxlR family transcriptional regulator